MDEQFRSENFGMNTNDRPYLPPNSPKPKKDFSKILIYLPTIALVIIALALASTVYYNYNQTGEITLFQKQVCAPVMQCPPPQNITIPACPPAPDCSPSLYCGNYSINTTAPIVNVYTNSS
jgi:hypothetical protein